MVTDSIDLSPIRFRITTGKIALLLLANTLIALFVFITYPGTKFIISLIFSQCIGITCATFVAASLRLFKIPRFPLQIAVAAAATVVGSAIGVAAAYGIVRFVVPVAMPSVLPDEKYKLHATNMLYALLFGSIGSYIFISYQKISDEKIKRLELEKNAVVTEIKLLQSQMEPHFLFNTLSNILGLIDTDPEKAKRMLESFTAFLRSSLVTARSGTVTLAQELDVVKNYLHVFAVRMGDRLGYSIDIPDSLRDITIAPLIIQPLVENALKHGLEPLVQGGVITIRAVRQGDTVIITVADSGAGIQEKGSGNSIGLANIERRLELLYGGRGRLFLQENEPRGLKAVIEIPYDTGAGNHR